MSSILDYSRTLNLPRTDFPMKADLPRREPQIQAWWEKLDLYRRVRRWREGKPKFILHDGPPYANGDIHLGTALNKVLKDIVVKFATMDGYDAPYVPGWDTHGLPIEHAAIKMLGLDRHRITPLELRQKCKEYALKYKDIQKEQFKRLGVGGDWENPYITLVPEYEGKQIEVFGEMAQKGYIYKGLKPVYWCRDCETALAEAEIEYHDKTSPSIYVAFPVREGKGLLPGGSFLVIWTTTPWTLPANLAIAVHPDRPYGIYRTPRGKLVLARELAEAAMQRMGIGEFRLEDEFPGTRLEGVICRHPFYDRDSVVILAEHVTVEEGTGCVHTAPGHGREDFEIGQKYGLPVLNPVDGRGVFTAEAGQFAGLGVEEANGEIIRELAGRGLLLKEERISHQYAHCWRCKNPILYRATEQWFASVEGFRREALRAIAGVRWIPSWGEERIHNMVAEREDWCISRQRVWGVPIPIFYCLDCGKPIITRESIRAVADLFRREGSDAWFDREAADILPPGTRCPGCEGGGFRKETDTMDVWFDSGSSHAAVLETRPELAWPADLYLEGSDQHRGWFQSSLLTAVATRDAAPYRQVLTHGFVVDGEGRKMSKSLGNVISPQEIIDRYGADILRLWVASSDYRQDIRVSQDILKQLAEAYRKIRNTARFLLGNLYDFDPATDAVPYRDLPEIDRWTLHELQKLVGRVVKAYRDYEYHLVYYAIHHFCTVDLSAFYLDVLKDRLYTSGSTSPARCSAQTALYEILATLARLLAPILAYTAEEIWQNMRHLPGDPESVHLADMPALKEEYFDRELERRWDGLLEVRGAVSKALELARERKLIGTSLEAEVEIYPDGAQAELLKEYTGQLPTVFIVSRVEVYEPGSLVPEDAYQANGLAVRVGKAPGAKCERCWVYDTTVGEDGDHPGLCGRCREVLREHFPEGVPSAGS